jgi:hypothetical protein
MAGLRQTDPRIPEAASAWKKDTLDCLSAEYEKSVCTDFTFDKLGISPELAKGLPLTLTVPLPSLLLSLYLHLYLSPFIL